jgi:hypothetical protein
VYYRFGNWTVSRTGIGTYSIVLPGFDAGCVSPTFPVIQLTVHGLGGGTAAFIIGAAGCPSGDMQLEIKTRDAAFAAADRDFDFTLYGRPHPGLSPALVDDSLEDVVCTVASGGPTVCD